MPAIVVTLAPLAELLTVEEAKLHLRINHSDLDTYIESLISAARDYCERHTQRTFRTAVTRTVKLDEWWCEDYHPPFPPLLGVTSITYYDEDNVSRTLSAANYFVELSTNGGGRIVWTTDATIPDIYDREDAITITYTAGYADAAACPPVAMQAMRTKLTELFGVGTESELKAAAAATDRLLSQVDWTGYA